MGKQITNTIPKIIPNILRSFFNPLSNQSNQNILSNQQKLIKNQHNSILIQNQLPKHQKKVISNKLIIQFDNFFQIWQLPLSQLNNKQKFIDFIKKFKLPYDFYKELNLYLSNNHLNSSDKQQIIFHIRQLFDDTKVQTKTQQFITFYTSYLQQCSYLIDKYRLNESNKGKKQLYSQKMQKQQNKKESLNEKNIQYIDNPRQQAYFKNYFTHKIIRNFCQFTNLFNIEKKQNDKSDQYVEQDKQEKQILIKTYQQTQNKTQN